MKKPILFMMVILSAFIFLCSEKGEKIEVIADVANIRSAPGMDGQIVGKAFRGEVYFFEKKDGDWYKILFKTEGNEFGFIHSITVKELYVEKKIEKSSDENINKKVAVIKKSESEKPKLRSKSKRIKKKRNKITHENLFSGFFLKGGWMTSPSGVSIGDGWISSVGFDRPIGKYLTWGFEFQPYFRTESIPLLSTKLSAISSNLFLNVKGGINMGKILNVLKSVNLYLGAGAGSQLSFQSIKFEGDTFNEFVANFIWHILFGAEFEIGKLNLIFEWQFDKTTVKNLEPSTVSTTFLMFGIRF